MKFLLVGLCLSFAAFASEPILLDAACKTTCIVNVTQVVGSQSYSTKVEYADVYTDYKGLTREQVDNKSQKSAMNAVCKAAFSEKATASSSDCLTFKHD